MIKDSSYSWPAFSENDCSSTGPGGPPAKWSRSQTLTRTATRDGTAVNNWRQKIASHQDATSAMTATYDTIRYTYGRIVSTCDYKFPPYYHQVQEVRGAIAVNNGFLDRRVKPPSKDLTEVQNGASSKFYKKLRSLRQEWSAPTFLGELAETYRMLRKPAKALQDSAGHFLDSLRKRKGFKGRPGDVPKAIGGLWLEHAFGWVPLISDMEAAAKAYERLISEKTNLVEHIQASFTKEYDRSSELSSYDKFSTVTSYCGTSQVPTRAKVKWEERNTIRYKAAIKRELEATMWDDWALFGFQPSEFIPTAWELLPWSFLVDYFVNVDDILNASVTSTSNVIYIVRTLRRFSRYYGTIEKDPGYLALQKGPTFVTSMEGSPQQFALTRKTISRTKVDSVPLPRLEFTLGQSANHVMNMVSLLAQANALYPQSYFRRKSRHHSFR